MDEKIRVLFVTDDIRMFTGVGIQARKLATGLVKTGKFEVSVIGGSDQAKNYNPTIISGVNLYPISGGYGNPDHFRVVYKKVKPHIIVLFSDPRFFEYIFMRDNEFRAVTKLVLYHTWDNDPFPKFNLPWYSACDNLVMISEFSHKLMTKNNLDTEHIPHGIDPTEFYPLPKDLIDRERQHLRNILNRPNINFFVFWNNRNIWRKRPMDVMNIFQDFNRKHPDTAIILHTDAIDMQGTNLPSFIENCTHNLPIVAHYEKANVQQLNLFYNVADVTLNISYAEGFGLCVTESLATGTPVIATKTGGMPEQMTLEDGSELGYCVEPVIRSYFGVPQAPYIHNDWVANETVVDYLEKAYERKKQGKWKEEIGPKAVKHIQTKYHTDRIVEKWVSFLEQVKKEPNTYKSWQCITA